MNINVSYYTARGGREINQDSVSLLEDGLNTLALVADGLGGHQDGEVASKQAVATLNRQLHSVRLSEEALVEAVCQANADIHALQTPGRKMRTTIAALWLSDGLAVAANVGDTRIYQFRDGNIVYQSMDHSVAQMAVLIGELKPEDIRQSPDKNKLIRVLGEADTPKVDTQVLSLKAGDRFLLCTDGFWGEVTENEMLTAMAKTSSAQEWLDQMRWNITAFEDESQDNHTAIALIIN